MSERNGRLVRRIVAVLVALFVVLLGTGLYQTFRYVPSTPAAWTGHAVPWAVSATGTVHRLAAWAFGAVALALLIVIVLRVTARRVSRVAAVLLLLATVGAAVTGPMLRWSQIALYAVTVGTSIRGVVDLAIEPKFFIVDGHVVSISTYDLHLWLHLVVFPVLVLAFGALVWRGARLAPKSPEPVAAAAGVPVAG